MFCSPWNKEKNKTAPVSAGKKTHDINMQIYPEVPLTLHNMAARGAVLLPGPERERESENERERENEREIDRRKSKWREKEGERTRKSTRAEL